MFGLNGGVPIGIGAMTGGARGLCNAGQRFFGRKGNRSILGYGFGMSRCRAYRNRNAGFFGRAE